MRHSRRSLTNQMLLMFSAENSIGLMRVALFIPYCVIPAIIYLYFIDQVQYLQLTIYALVAIVFITIGYKWRILDKRMRNGAKRLTISRRAYTAAIFSVFVMFAFVTVLTAPSVPLISALAGADAEVLSDERGSFLKGREGAWVALAYLSSILTSTFVPVAVVASYASKHKLRHVFLIVAMLYMLIFMVKALFLNIVLPLVAWGIERGSIRARQLVVIALVAVVALMTMISLSGYGDLEGSGYSSFVDYLTAAYVPGSTFDFFIYRSLAIPIFSVADTLYVHQAELGGSPLLGATSSLISGVFGMERVNIERMVFAYQYGGWNDFGNSNVVFIADAYVNFGIAGVAAYGLIIGLSLRLFRNSDDPALRSMAPLYVFLLYSSPLIGMMFSNGFLLLFLQALFVRVR